MRLRIAAMTPNRIACSIPRSRRVQNGNDCGFKDQPTQIALDDPGRFRHDGLDRRGELVGKDAEQEFRDEALIEKQEKSI
jgi:hypothetical protein